MKKNTVIKKEILIISFAILGSLFGACFMKPTNSNFSVIETLYNNAEELNSIKNLMSLLCRSSVISLSIVFLSGLTFFPMPFCIPLFLFRGIALGYAITNFGSTSTELISLLTYFLITILLAVLLYYSLDFSGRGKKDIRIKLPIYTYKYLMICGAAITVRCIPILINMKLIK